MSLPRRTLWPLLACAIACDSGQLATSPDAARATVDAAMETVDATTARVDAAVSPDLKPPGCIDGDPSGDLASFGYTRQCTGTIHSINNTLHPTWDNTYAGLMSGPFPGSVSQFGFGFTVSVGANRYASFRFNTGATPSGVQIQPNTSYGTLGLLSVSTVPGDYFSGSALCVGSTLNISSKPGTAANCKLAPNTDYYLNFSSASYATPHDTVCATQSCTTGWTPYVYSN